MWSLSAGATASTIQADDLFFVRLINDLIKWRLDSEVNQKSIE